jgi:hypothetical protein
MQGLQVFKSASHFCRAFEEQRQSVRSREFRGESVSLIRPGNLFTMRCADLKQGFVAAYPPEKLMTSTYLSPITCLISDTAPLEARLSLACGNRGQDCQLEARLWVAQERLSQPRWHGTLARPGGHGQQPTPHHPRQVNRTSREGKLPPSYH